MVKRPGGPNRLRWNDYRPGAACHSWKARTEGRGTCCATPVREVERAAVEITAGIGEGEPAGYGG